jgi:hypothetical protein
MKPFQIFANWGEVWKEMMKRSAIVEIFMAPFVMVPYAPIITLSMCGIIFTMLSNQSVTPD